MENMGEDADESEFLKSIYVQADSWIELVQKRTASARTTSYADKLQQLQKRLRFLMRLLRSSRHPRLAVIGRRGSGKSSLLNALLSEQVSLVGHVKAQTGRAQLLRYRTQSDLGFDVLDTRGLNEGGVPDSEDVSLTAVDSIVEALNIMPVDAILFVHKLTEVDSSLEADFKAFQEVSQKSDTKKLPLIVVLTHADEVEPSDIKKDYDEEKLENIEACKQVFLQNVYRSFPQISQLIVGCVAVSSFVVWQKGPDYRLVPHPVRDYRYNMDQLLDLLLRNVQVQAMFKTIQMSRTVQVKREFCVFIIRLFSSLAAIVSMTPIPTSDFLPLSGINSYMVYTISRLGTTQISLAKFLTVIGVTSLAGLSARYMLSQLLKLSFIPGLSQGSSAVISYSMTSAVGYASIAYFIDNKTDDEVRKIFDQVREEEVQEELLTE